MEGRASWKSPLGVYYLLLACLLNTFPQRFLQDRLAYASHSPSLTVFYTQTQILDLRDVVLTQRLILLTCAADNVLTFAYSAVNNIFRKQKEVKNVKILK